MAPVSDPYRALGVPRGANKADIKAAHRKLAKRYHPDTAAGESRRFLIVQEAYRVLSDPLLRREWDTRHAPGPMRADSPAARTSPTARTAKPATARPDRTTPRPRRASPPEPRQPAAAPAQPETTGARPRSTHSYTWSAAEVPWWEEGVKRDPKRRATPKPTADGAPAKAEGEPPAQPDFEVYNRSSGAAWSMAARAYFRKGDADLPSRGVFRQQGGQPLTAGRARAAAEADARRKPTGAAPDNEPGGDHR